MAKAFVHSWWPAKEDGDVLVCGVNPSKGRLAQFHQKQWYARLGLEVLVISQGKG